MRPDDLTRIRHLRAAATKAVNYGAESQHASHRPWTLVDRILGRTGNRELVGIPAVTDMTGARPWWPSPGPGSMTRP